MRSVFSFLRMRVDVYFVSWHLNTNNAWNKHILTYPAIYIYIYISMPNNRQFSENIYLEISREKKKKTAIHSVRDEYMNNNKIEN